MTLRLLSLCSGIGMIDYVWSVILKQEIAGQVEINPYCQALLSERWPDVPKSRDLKELTKHDPFETVDVVAGGIPCQPFSGVGKRRGTDDDRHLWPYAFAIVQRHKPTWVLIENVARFAIMALDVVQADLESANYQSQAYVLPACAVGAPHARERVFILPTGCATR
jgi:DNA (cytosine-5)-methyltransferase 1